MKALVLAGAGVTFVRSPRYLAEKLADAVDVRMRDVRDEARFWRSVMRTWELRPSELPELQARVAAKYCRNLDIWSALPELGRRYRLILAFSGPRTILDCWRSSYTIDRTFDEVVEAVTDSLTARDAALYRLIAERTGGQPEEYALVDDTADGVSAALTAGMRAYRYGTSYGLRLWLAGVDAQALNNHRPRIASQ